ncbi:hypothetical protein COU76_04465 [Candidatus Peregrinibacteria bacterium CG10_big_fil_rev_8_21_14_0_10_49_10]|nr:MAG: hypothetical protein COU76_04465 [Candidatus Peregrinibacteria bacterium CG10_big_fil_rev_8_21_14_0_10_49_10]
MKTITVCYITLILTATTCLADNTVKTSGIDLWTQPQLEFMDFSPVRSTKETSRMGDEKTPGIIRFYFFLDRYDLPGKRLLRHVELNLHSDEEGTHVVIFEWVVRVGRR